jgi:PAS domain S-box-containing protein
MDMKKEIRNSGINVIGDVPWGTHFCQFYQTKKDLIDMQIPYFKAGLENNEFCFWITSQPLEVEDAKKALREAVPDLDTYFEKGQIEVVSYFSWCINRGTYNPKKIMDRWFEKLDHALESGYDGLRLAGNTSWFKNKEWNGFIEAEKKVDSSIDKYRMIVMCSYPFHKCGATKIIDVIINHDFALIKRNGKWENIENSKRKKAEEKIKILANAVESSDDAIMTESLEGIITSWNKGAEQIYGYSAEEILGKNISILEPNTHKGEIKQLIEEIKQGKHIRHYETVRLKSDSTLMNESVTLSPIFDASGKLMAISAIARDITERVKAEKLLVKTEEARKKEIHHRIKNNLQVISSLLDLQAEKFQDKKVLEAFKESQSRVLSMSLIHEELYKGRGTDTLNFSRYLQRLATNLFQTYSLNSKNICLYVDLEENTFFNMDTAIPLGIIVNELISNSLKHAFTEDKEGKIRVRLCREEISNETHTSLYSLTISDDGIGIPNYIEPNYTEPNYTELGKFESLGLQLVQTLVDQINGEMELKIVNGTEFKIKFNV